MKGDANPMHPVERLQGSPRCHAKNKRTGLPCKAPAVRGWTVCRMHGARGGISIGKNNPAWRHGMRSYEAIALRKLVADLARDGRAAAAALPDADS